MFTRLIRILLTPLLKKWLAINIAIRHVLWGCQDCCNMKEHVADGKMQNCVYMNVKRMIAYPLANIWNPSRIRDENSHGTMSEASYLPQFGTSSSYSIIRDLLRAQLKDLATTIDFSRVLAKCI